MTHAHFRKVTALVFSSFELFKHKNKPHLKTEKGGDGKITQSHSGKGVCATETFPEV